MPTYIVTCDKFELRRGSHFIALPVPVKPGDLCLISIEDILLAGRYYPDVAGARLIVIPGYLITVTGKLPVRILGKIVPTEQPRFRQIGQGFPEVT